MKHAGHSSQNGGIDVARSVCCPDDHDVAVGIGHQTIPETHELGLDHRCRLVVT